MRNGFFLIFLDAIAIVSPYPCQWMGQFCTTPPNISSGGILVEWPLKIPKLVWSIPTVIVLIPDQPSYFCTKNKSGLAILAMLYTDISKRETLCGFVNLQSRWDLLWLWNLLPTAAFSPSPPSQPGSPARGEITSLSAKQDGKSEEKPQGKSFLFSAKQEGKRSLGETRDFSFSKNKNSSCFSGFFGLLPVLPPPLSPLQLKMSSHFFYRVTSLLSILVTFCIFCDLWRWQKLSPFSKKYAW